MAYSLNSFTKKEDKLFEGKIMYSYSKYVQRKEQNGSWWDSSPMKKIYVNMYMYLTDTEA